MLGADGKPKVNTEGGDGGCDGVSVFDEASGVSEDTSGDWWLRR